MRRVFLSPAIALGVALALTPLSVLGGTAAAATAAEPSDELYGKFDDAVNAENFGEALKIAEKLPTPRNNSEVAALTLAMRASALIGLARGPDAQRQIDKSVALQPKGHWPDNVIMWGGITAKNYPFALAALDRMIARHPDKVREMSNDLVSFIVNKAPKDDKLAKDDRFLALARIRFGAQPYPDLYAFPAMRVLIDRGDIAGAEALLPYVYGVESLQLMLIMRRYEPLWPKVAALVGPRMEKARAAEVERTRLLLVANPEHPQRLAAHVGALVAAGRLDRAIELRAAIPSTPQAMSKLDKDGAWLVNNLALALDKNGQAEEADRLFAMLNDAAKPDGGWRVNMFINRLDLLVDDGKFDRAESLLEATAKVAETEGSDYARQLVRRMRFCIKSRLGKTAEAAAARSVMLEHAADAKIATLSGLLCANDLGEAEKLTRKFEEDHDFRNGLVEALQARPLSNSDPSAWQKNWSALRARPYFRDLFAKLGRDLPEELYFSTHKAAAN